jgi:hypothetical protein
MASFLATAGFITTPRWATSFTDIVRVSPLHAEVTRDALDLVVRDAEPPKDGTLLPLLEILHTLCLETRAALRPDTRAKLASIKGSSKTAMLARTLAALDGDGQEHRGVAADQLLGAGVERGERWMAVTEAPEG